jgi:hypothetical protein
VYILGQTCKPDPHKLISLAAISFLYAKSGSLFSGGSRAGFGGEWRLFLRFRDEEQGCEMRNHVTCKRFVVLIGMLLGSHAPATAQTSAPQPIMAQERAAPPMAMLPTAPTALAARSTLLYQDPGNSPGHFNRLFVGAYERDPTLEGLLPMERVKNLVFTQVSFPLVQLWGGRLQLGAFQSTLHIQNVQPGPLGYAGSQGLRSAQQSYSGGPRSVRLSGLSLSYHFGGNARAARPTEGLRRLTRIVDNVLN